MTITECNSNNTLTPAFNELIVKEIIWMNSLAYQPRMKKYL